MTVAISNTELTNSFNTWRLNTNHMATVISNNVVTVARAGDANRNAVSVGNGHIKGTFTANEFRTTTLKSGNTSDAGGWLYVLSNTVINATSLAVTSNTTFSGNVTFNTAGTDRVNLGAVGRLILSGGSIGQFLRVASENDNIEFKTLSLRDIADLSTNSAPIILSAANTSYSDNGDTPHIKFANANDAIHVFMGGGEGGSGISDLLVQLADAGASSRLVIADSSNVAVAYIDSDGTIYAAKNLTVDGVTALNGAVTIGDASTDTITVKGNFANQSTTGTAVFNGTTTFNGTTNMNGTLNLNGNVNVGDAAADVMTVTSTASMNGNTTIGNSTADTLTINSRMVSHLIANGSYDLGTISLPWRKLYATEINAAGKSTLSALHANGAVDFDSTLDVDGAATFNGNVTLGDADTDTITVKGKFANQSTTGTASFNGNMFLGNASTDTITVKGNFANQYTSGTGNFNKLGVKIPSVTTGYDAEVKNSVKIGQNLTVGGNTSITGTLNVTGGITIPANTIIAVANGIFDNIIVNNDAVFGTDAANTVTFNSVVGSNFSPKTGSRYNLGATGSRWQYLYANNASLSSSLYVNKNATISGNTVISGQLNVSKNVVISGNLAVSGTVTTINTETINLADNIIALNSNHSGSPTQNAGVNVNRGTSANVALIWNETTDRWQVTSKSDQIVGSFDNVLTANGYSISDRTTITSVDATNDYLLIYDATDTKLKKVNITNSALVGPQGAKGQKGQKGEVGAKGQKGEVGATGPQGAKGQKGATGATGPQGPAGPTGPTGPQGAKGQKGEVGATGPQGAKGQKGATGSTGPQGAKGQKGEVGSTGPTGPTGPQGAQGAKGQKGATGSTGPTGPQGAKGQKGEAGGFTTGSNAQVNSLGVNTAASGTAGEIRATNNITAYYSDERLKNFESVIGNALDIVKSLNGYYFYGNDKAAEFGYDTEKRQVGVNAQEVQRVLPELVTEAPIDPDYLTVYYEKLVPVLIEAIKELSDKVDALNK